MSTLRQIGIEMARISDVSEKVDERLVSAGGGDNEDMVEYTVTLKMTVYSKADIDTIREMAAEPYDGAVDLLTTQ